MRKSLFAFFTMFFVMPCVANIHIDPDIVLDVIKKHVSSDKVNDTVREYNTQLKASNGTGISASKLWNVCAAAGWDIKQVAENCTLSKLQDAMSYIKEKLKINSKEDNVIGVEYEH